MNCDGNWFSVEVENQQKLSTYMYVLVHLIWKFNGIFLVYFCLNVHHFIFFINLIEVFPKANEEKK